MNGCFTTQLRVQQAEAGKRDEAIDLYETMSGETWD